MTSCKIMAGLVALTISVCPAVADTLAEAIQQGLIAHPDVMLSATHTLPHAQGADSWHSKNHRYSSTAVLALGNQPALAKDLTRQDVADDFVLKIIERYLDVLRSDRLLENAQQNFRLHRTVFVALSQEKNSSAAHQAELRQVRARLAVAESAQMQAETKRHQAKTRYAAVVGRWPARLEWPVAPDNHDLPASVGQAIEQGLDNYSLPAANQGNQHMKRRSMIALSDAIRQSWEGWTATGLQINPLQKRLLAAERARNTLKEEFNQDGTQAFALLDAQDAFYQAQNDYAKTGARELAARYRILSSVGRLMPFVTKMGENDTVAAGSMDIASSAESALLQMADSDKAAYPYPSYKPQFQAELARTMKVTALNMPDLADKSEVMVNKNSSLWYVSAGNFKNRANAIALADRLKLLGFMVHIQTRDNDSSVLIGPYEFRGHAMKGIMRLKETAHVQGVLVVTKHKTTQG